ncbi:MAG: DUF1674 domain-containing protein [Alphaproteobacteria bacterium]|nr:DUF1674 domain-containing protein [Alphaproteobacteria bacterium]
MTDNNQADPKALNPNSEHDADYDDAAVATSEQPEQAELSEPELAEPELIEPEVTEHGGPKGLEPTRFGDWEKNGRCSDF